MLTFYRNEGAATRGAILSMYISYKDSLINSSIFLLALFAGLDYHEGREITICCVCLKNDIPNVDFASAEKYHYIMLTARADRCH